MGPFKDVSNANMQYRVLSRATEGYMGPFEDTHFNAILFTGLVALLVITPLNMIENLSALRPTPPLSA